MKIFPRYLLITILSVHLLSATEPKKMVIRSSVASLRITPKTYVHGQENDEQLSRNMFGRFYDRFVQALPPAYRDPNQDTQLLYNEQILCLEELPDNWLKIEALEQYVFNRKNKSWQHVQGHIKKEQAQAVENFEKANIVVCKPTTKAQCSHKSSQTLPIGTKLLGSQDLHDHYRVTLLDGRVGLVDACDVRPLVKYNGISMKTLRANIVSTALELLGNPYNWGGRSSSCDCSGLINLAYRCNGLELPRNVYPMFLKSKRIKHGSELRPGDVIFRACADHPENFNHIVMYIGNNKTIESCVSKGIAIFTANERFGKSITELNSGDILKASATQSVDYVISLGSFLNDISSIRQLNDYALGNYLI